MRKNKNEKQIDTSIRGLFGKVKPVGFGSPHGNYGAYPEDP